MHPIRLPLSPIGKLIVRTSCLLLLFLLPGRDGLAAQPSAESPRRLSISGYVMDHRRKALELAGITEVHSQAATVSDANGYYELSVPQRDTLTLYFTCLSYQTAVRIVPAESSRLQLNVILQPLSHSLQDVSITAQSHRTGSMEKIDPSDIRLLPDPAGGSIEALLVTFAGVSSNNELSTQYSVRGGNYDENLVYVNGVEVYRPLLIRSGQQEGLSFVNPQLTADVRFSAGGFEARYGDKAASVLDIRYKDPQEFEASLHASLLGANVYVGSASRDGRLSQIHGLRYKTNAYLLGSLDTKGEYRPSYFDYQTSVNWRLSPATTLSFLGNISQNSYRFVPQTRETETGTFQTKYSFRVYFDGQEEDMFRTAFGALNLKYEPDRHLQLSLQTSLFRTDEQETFDITGQYWLSQSPIKNSRSDTVNSRLIGVGTYHEHARNRLAATVLNLGHHGTWQGDAHQLHWGAAWQYEHLDDRLREWEMRDSAGYSQPYSDQTINFVENLRSENRLDNHRLTAYLQDTWKTRIRGGLLSLTAGLRSQWWSFNRQWLLSPRVSAGFIPAWEQDFVFRLAGGIYYQAPFYKEIRDTVLLGGVSTVVLNHDIRAPKSTQVIFGTDYHFSLWERPFKFTAEAYYKKMDDLIPYTVDNVRIRYEGVNHGSARTWGCDMKLFGEFIPGTDSWITLSLMDSKEHLDGQVIPSPNEQRYNISMFFRDYLPRNPKYSMTLRVIWADGLSFGPPSMPKVFAVNRMKPYRRMDIGLSRLLVGGEDKLLQQSWLRSVKDIWISLECFNLLGIDNTNSYYWVRDISGQEWAIPNYLTGRQLNLSLSVDF
ncbi:MAG: carboxypeptidase-like regulatory domain-containing protein [Bacteroidales bacterium]|nr:carboxypeptidase-like regulatory domain-containing protein [Bacteroidales bacterium]